MKIRTATLVVVFLVGVWTATQGQDNPQNSQSSSQLVLKATPPKAIPVFSTYNLGRQAFYYAGGSYVESKNPNQKGQKIMHGAMYVDVWVPKEIRQPYPIVFFHGNGQTATDWMQTPDGRPGWRTTCWPRDMCSTWLTIRLAAARPTCRVMTATSESARRITRGDLDRRSRAE